MAKLVSERADVIPALAEVFREYGFEGASLSLISERTGLGKGSLYNFFPGGKQEMASAVLKEIEGWFTTRIFAPLQWEADPRAAIEQMLEAVREYFQSGRRVCLVGAFAVASTRDLFAKPVRSYFAIWQEALAGALARAGKDKESADQLAEEALASIQGSLILARALGEPAVFERALKRLLIRLLGR